MTDINKKNINTINIDWYCNKTWNKSAKNTLWCLLGCSIGDFGTIIFFQYYNFSVSTLFIMVLAIFNGLITSVLLETLILLKQMKFNKALSTALGMSFISMISMEISMNLTDLIILGEPIIVWWIIPIMLFFGFITVWPYNYWRLKVYNFSCH